jgi:hypothetical protein
MFVHLRTPFTQHQQESKHLTEQKSVYNAAMKKKRGKPKNTNIARAKPLKLPGTFNELIAKSLQTKKPKGGWSKPTDPTKLPK